MPHLKRVREIDKSCKPPLTKLITSLRLESGAIKSGAKEYIPLPPNEELIAAVLEAITEENNNVIYKSSAMEKVIALANQVAPSDANILITGESGTGKEVIARYIHRKSKRANNNYISINCAAIPENLLESELFGHEKGAFTGAIARRLVSSRKQIMELCCLMK